MIYCTRKVQRPLFNGHNSVSMRSLKHYSKDRLIEELTKADWEPIFSCKDVCLAWASFKGIFTKVIDKVAPTKVVRIKQRTEPWMNIEILSLIRERNNAFKTHNQNGDPTLFSQYKSLRNEVRQKIVSAKKFFFSG